MHHGNPPYTVAPQRVMHQHQYHAAPPPPPPPAQYYSTPNPSVYHNVARPGPTGQFVPQHAQFNHHQAGSSLRNVAPVHHVYSQPSFRVGPASSFAPPHAGLQTVHHYQPPIGFPQSHAMSYGSTPYGLQQRQQPIRPRQVAQDRPAAKRPRFAFFCETCTKGFECEEDFDIHVAEDHVTCTHPGCGFSAREDVVRAHKVKHAVNTESEEEISAWIAMRRFKFPRKESSATPAEEPKTISKLEQFIRGSLRQARIDARKQRMEREQKQPCIHWERTGKCKFGDSCSFAHEKQGLCTFFVNHGRCRHGDACKYKHVRASSGELEELRNPHGGLLKKLLAVETTRHENKILQVLRHIVNNNFYATESPENVVEEVVDEEEEYVSEDDEEEEDCGDLSPISNP